jgi:signal transduction histidine kinase
LNTELPEELYLEVDEIRIKQVLTNLISNAIKNTPSNGNIDVSLKEIGTYSYITIKDTGVGFTEKEMEKIFKKFGKIERYGKQLDVDIEGSGLGLYLSKEIVDLHDGQIWVESEGRNKGATFIVKLPII